MTNFNPGTLVSINGISRDGHTYLNYRDGITYGRYRLSEHVIVYLLPDTQGIIPFCAYEDPILIKDEHLSKKEVITNAEKRYYMLNSFILTVQKTIDEPTIVKEVMKNVLDICSTHPDMRRVLYLEGVLAACHGLLNESHEAKSVLLRMMNRNAGKSLFAYSVKQNLSEATLIQAVQDNPIFVSQCMLVLLLTLNCHYNGSLNRAIELSREVSESSSRLDIIRVTVEEMFIRMHEGRALRTREACLLLLHLDPNHTIAKEEFNAGFKGNGQPTTERQF